MSIAIKSDMTEAELLYNYLGKRIQNGGRTIAVEDLLAEYRAYRRELAELRTKVQEGLASSARGESKPLDLDDVFRRGRERLAAKGTTE